VSTATRREGYARRRHREGVTSGSPARPAGREKEETTLSNDPTTTVVIGAELKREIHLRAIDRDMTLRAYVEQQLTRAIEESAPRDR